MTQALQKYLDSAVTVLQRYNIVPRQDEQTQIAALLQDIVSVDEPKVLAIARTLQHAGTFNELVRDNIEDVNVGQRYADITQMFDSIREDARTLVQQLQDGKIDLGEKAQNLWMRLRRGTPHSRFEKIKDTYLDVSDDTRNHLDRETAILEAYIEFRFALKTAEALAHEVLKSQEARLNTAKTAFTEAAERVKTYQGTDSAERSRLELARDQAQHAYQQEDRRYQLVKDVAENLQMGYNVGETLVAKLKQTHDLKDRVYRRAVTFFQTNEHVFTTMDAVYTSQRGLHEATQTLEAMQTGMNRGLEDIAELGDNLERAALKAGYGSTYNPESVRKLVEAVVKFQEESLGEIQRLREESTASAKLIGQIVDQGKERYRAALEKYLATQQQQKPETRAQ